MKKATELHSGLCCSRGDS